jgi:hypothetical protein
MPTQQSLLKKQQTSDDERSGFIVEARLSAGMRVTLLEGRAVGSVDDHGLPLQTLAPS